MKPLPYLALVFAASGVFGFAAPQQPAAPPPVIKVKTDLVTLAATVVDERGSFVAGLSQDDFIVYDGGEPQMIHFFTSEDVPSTIGLVIDSSGSMQGRRADITAAATAFAAMSHPLDEFFTVNFNEYVWLGLRAPLTFTEDMEELHSALSAAPAYGMTALYDAVDRALYHLERGTRDRKALIVVSDGGDNASSQTLEAVLEHARRSSTSIYAIALRDLDARDANPAVLKQLARETGGRAFTPKHAGAVAIAFEQIAQEIRSGYTIAFDPPEGVAPGFRPLRVVADAGDGRELTVRTRAGYYAGASNGAAR